MIIWMPYLQAICQACLQYDHILYSTFSSCRAAAHVHAVSLRDCSAHTHNLVRFWRKLILKSHLLPPCRQKWSDAAGPQNLVLVQYQVIPGYSQ